MCYFYYNNLQLFSYYYYFYYYNIFLYNCKYNATMFLYFCQVLIAKYKGKGNFMSDKDLTDLARQKRNEYHREWQKRNREKVRQSQERHWQKKAIESLGKEKTQNGFTI